VNFACPSCRSTLENRGAAWDGWLRCPVCGHATLPPELDSGPPARARKVALDRAEDAIIFLPDSSSSTDGQTYFPVAESARPVHTSPARLIFTTGLALSLFLVLVACLDYKMGNAVVFGGLAVGFFLLLVRSSRHRSPS
jgi:hypothetical protein